MLSHGHTCGTPRVRVHGILFYNPLVSLFWCTAVTTRRQYIIDKLQELNPTHLDVLNESNQHAGPPGRESHFRVRVVSDFFDGKSRVSRHREINKRLSDILGPGGVHALAMELYSDAEWQKREGVGVESPECEGVRKV